MLLSDRGSRKLMVPGGDEVRQIPPGRVYRGHLGYLTGSIPGQKWLMPVHAAITQPRLRCSNGAHRHCRSLLTRQLANGIWPTLSPWEIIVARVRYEDTGKKAAGTATQPSPGRPVEVPTVPAAGRRLDRVVCRR